MNNCKQCLFYIYFFVIFRYSQSKVSSNFSFRRVNEHKEEYLMEIFEQFKDCKPQDLKVRDKFALCAEKKVFYLKNINLRC